MSPAERAIRALRRGDGVTVGAITFESVEVRPLGLAPVLISWERAAALKLVNQRAAAWAGEAVMVLDADRALDLTDPTHDLQTPLKGPFQTAPVEHPDDAAAALRLARLAGLLPAVRLLSGGPAPVAVSIADIAAFDSAPRLRIAGRARLPTGAGGPGELIAFRSDGGGPEHMALIVGEPVLAEPVLTRLHSSCLTGDVFGSLRCDCGPQLHAALAALRAGGGLLLYLNQEGRGIGLVNKLRAYQLQDQGFDTLDANERLGFAPDLRDFRLASAMLVALGVRAVRLLTNNPDKVAALESAGVRVTERVPLAVGEGAENARYLETKRVRAGHLF